MLEYIKGRIDELTPTYAVIDNMGLGYMLNISLSAYNELQSLAACTEVKMYVHEVIREDEHQLYGFVEKREREMFLLLISVSGVGPNSARMILSSLTTADLEEVISTGNDRALKSVKGIGSKTAQRIIVDLRDKIKPGNSTLISMVGQRSQVYDEALSALVMLGFTQQMSQKALQKLFKEEPEIGLEAAIKKALKMM